MPSKPLGLPEPPSDPMPVQADISGEQKVANES